MTILQALDRYYDRMAARGEAESPGYSREKISFVVVLSADGAPIDKIDLRDHSGKKPQPRLLEVPAAVKRTAGVSPNLFWDKTAYTLGRTAGVGKRAAEEHAAFKSRHLDLLEGASDLALLAFRKFMETWASDSFDQRPFSPEMLDTNLIFRLEGDSHFLHESAGARALISGQESGALTEGACLVTGATGRIRRLHPTIRGVEGAQTSGAALVSFNLDASTSYGMEQGDNAPTSESAAFRYGAALNRMLDRGGPNRLPRPIGDATVVFWADASGAGEEAAKAAEENFAEWFNPPVATADNGSLDADEGQAAKLRDALRDVAAGRPLGDIDPRLSEGVRFHVLGLAPNAARLSVRYWLDDRFEVFAQRLAQHYDDLSIAPSPWRATPPAVQWLLVKTTALQGKFENIPPLLAGEMMRAVLGGGRYPRTLLVSAIMRLRAGDNPESGWHAAAIRAVLARDRRLRFPNEERTWLMSLQRDLDDPPYQLGRMFALLEAAQRMAIGKVNATIRDRYFGAASASPASVFPLLLRGVQNHLSKLRKERKGGWIEREIEDISDLLPVALPRTLSLEAQGRFVIGFYHQRKAQFAGRPAEDIEQEEGDNDDN